MARSSDFDFAAVNAKLRPGGFYHSAGDAAGRMMVAWGRGRANKFVELSQDEIGNFLANGIGMYRTDDPAIKDALATVAALIAGSKPRWADLNALLTQVTAGDVTAQAAANDVMAMVQGGKDVDAAIAEANKKYARGIPETPKPNAPKVAAAKAR